MNGMAGVTIDIRVTFVFLVDYLLTKSSFV